ncbi:DUF3179 domain-containing protein [Aquisalimonas sp.]|uniref:DUF3179 domain-containing protein n=1 Tax=Aquisalimonas sp. TaxID=1872621 RepID=UPI0025BE60EA|nr:DUF3179 domain-containing protein [Aquisalimonas sp.]
MARRTVPFLMSTLFAVPALGAEQALPTTEPPVVPLPLEQYDNDKLSGGPSKDGIPSIDDPRFWSVDRADAFLEDEDRVIGVYRNGKARAYPQRILVWHEIVNDTIAGDPVAVTYCPLTGTALGFERGETELGVSGRLVNSNLIMYDRATDSFWPQILGTAINGPLAGEGLEEFRVFWTTWENWRDRHPDTEVLSSDTGFVRNYRHDPYGDYTPVSGYYAEDSGTIFPVQHEDDRYPNKREVFGFRSSNGAVAVDLDHLAEEGSLTVENGDNHYLVLHDAGLDTAWVYRGDDPIDVPEGIEFNAAGPSHAALDSLEAVNGFEAMWFAWVAFYPDTQVIDGS